MKRALEETDRRRAKQVIYNEAHGITPKGVQKRVADVMHAGYEQLSEVASVMAADAVATYAAMPPARLAKTIAKLEKEMQKHAQNLEFEQAAAKRDEIRKLRELAFKSAA
jgi:excinuclease ABC subunit B